MIKLRKEILKMSEILKNRYEIEEMIGDGPAGKVFLVIDIRDGSKFVFEYFGGFKLKYFLFKIRKTMKKIDLDNVDTNLAIDIAQEATTLATLSHPNIIKYFDSFREGNFFYIITEYCQVNLFKYLIEYL